jgi:cytochrome c oxidase assembly factor 5
MLEGYVPLHVCFNMSRPLLLHVLLFLTPQQCDMCLCQQERKKTVTECAEELPEQCNSLRYALFACKRGQMDARSRIQGNKGY